MTFDKHAVALISIAGSSFDMLGALYLAYDLLGGENGPLRTLTRGITYGVLFGLGYGAVLGPVFGALSGAAHGITLAWEFARAARGRKASLWYDAAMSAIRGLGFGLGSGFLFGARFGIVFGVLSTVGQTIAYRFGVRPEMDYAPAARPRFSRRHLLAALNRAAGYTVAGYLSAWAGDERAKALALGLEAGLLIGAVTAISGACTPFIGWIADRVPARRMGVVGVVLILTGFALQSAQYWVALFDLGGQ